MVAVLATYLRSSRSRLEIHRLLMVFGTSGHRLALLVLHHCLRFKSKTFG